MDTLRDILTYLRRSHSGKRERALTIDVCVSRLRRIAARRRPPIPYERGPLGGYLVPFSVWDGRRGRERAYRVVIEMYAPTPARPYWFPVELTLDFLSACAITRTPVASGYRRFQSFASVRRCGNRLVFDRDTFYEIDWRDLDNVRARDEAPPETAARNRNARPGRHAARCADHDHRGPCATPPPSPAHTRKRPHERRPRRGGRRWSPRRATPRPLHPKSATRPLQHATISEVAAWDTAKGDLARFAALREDIAADIAAEEAARCFDRTYVRTATGLAKAPRAELTTEHSDARRN